MLVLKGTSIIFLCIHFIDFLAAFQNIPNIRASNTKGFKSNENNMFFAKPVRLDENEEGILYVNNRVSFHGIICAPNVTLTTVFPTGRF